MPEVPSNKDHAHPWRNRRAAPGGLKSPISDVSARYAELAVTSNFTFLTGGSHPDELAQHAAELGLHAVAITDRHTVAGIVRAHVAAREAGVKLLVGTRLVLADELELLIYPTDLAAYGRMCRLLTLGKRRAPKGECHLSLHDLIEHNEGLLAVVVPPAVIDNVQLEQLDGLRRVFHDDRLSIAASCAYAGDDAGRLARVASLSEHTAIPMVATNDVLYHAPDRRALQDVLTCIRHGCTLEQAGLKLQANAERHLKPPDEMARLFADYPHAVERTVRIADRIDFNLDQVAYQYPHEVCPPGRSPIEHLAELTWSGAAERYADLPRRVRRKIEHELRLIDELNYAPYFLTVHDLVVFARSRGILCQGRGAAANSAVCFCLGVTSVDPDRVDLLFERFVSRERDEPPDIDIDFEHERREEVLQYIYDKYGRDRAALTAEVISYRGRSAIREVGKALGLSLDCVDRLAKQLDWWDKGSINVERVREMGLDPDDPTMQRLADLAGQIMGFPRHLSQHVGGFVITDGPLCELVPIENAAMDDRTVIEWDKDDIDAMGMLKVDCLGLGMLTCLNKAYQLLVEAGAQGAACLGGPHHTLDLAKLPAEDPRVYDMICRADTVGVFQIESRAQMSMLPRLRPRNYYDLVIEVAIVRPGPIVGDMVHPYLRRRHGQEPAVYPTPVVEEILGKTLGVPLFQEQAMRLAIECAGFTPGEADQLRRAIAAWKRKQKVIFEFERKFIDGMTSRRYEQKFAEQAFQRVKGFSEYGFPESHAASFALIVYASAWLKCYHPAAFAAGLINSQPMGFYAPAQIIRDAKEHGVDVLPIDVNHSGCDCSLEGERAMRLGMRLVRGLRGDEAAMIEQAVTQQGPFDTIESLWRASGVRVATLRRLAKADAFGSMGFDRQHALWRVRRLRDERLPLFENEPPTADVALPVVTTPQQVVHDYAATGVSLRPHPLSFLRSKLDAMGATPNTQLADEKRWPNGMPITVAGLVLIRQRPSTASGVVFATIEDETGIANLIIRTDVWDRCRRAARNATCLLARGRVERQASVVHVLMRETVDLTGELNGLLSRSRDFR